MNPQCLRIAINTTFFDIDPHKQSSPWLRSEGCQIEKAEVLRFGSAQRANNAPNADTLSGGGKLLENIAVKKQFSQSWTTVGNRHSHKMLFQSR